MIRVDQSCNFCSVEVPEGAQEQSGPMREMEWEDPRMIVKLYI